MGLYRLARAAGPAQVEDAIRTLSQAAAEDPGRAAVFADLAAAWFVRYQMDGDPAGLTACLEFSRRALGVAPDDLGAWFNQSLALSALPLPEEAEASWLAYLDRETDAAWRAEAEERLGAVRALSTASPPPTLDDLLTLAEVGDEGALGEALGRLPQGGPRELGEEFFPRWAGAVLAGETAEAGRLAAAGAALGRAVGARTGDLLALQAVVQLGGAAPERQRALAAAVLLLAEGREAYRQRETERAITLLGRARAAVGEAGSPLVHEATFYRAVALYWGGDGAGDEALHSLAAELRDAPYPHLRGHLQWMLGLRAEELGDLATAEEHYALAAELFADCGSPELEAWMWASRAGLELTAGNAAGAWRHLGDALSRLAPFPHSSRLAPTLNLASDLARGSGWPRAAVFFGDLSLAASIAARERGEAGPSALVTAWRGHAELSLAVGDVERAVTDLETARSWLEQLRDETARNRAAARLLETAARLGELGALRFGAEGGEAVAPEPGIEALSAAITYQEATGGWVLLPELLAARAGRFEESSRPEEAIGDLFAALAWLERREISREAPAEHAAYLASAWRISGRLAALLVDQRGDYRAALDAVERWRNLTVGPRRVTGAGSVAVANLAANGDGIRARLPAGTVVLTTLALEDRLFLWLLDGDEIRFRQQPVGAEEIRGALAEVLRDLRRGRPGGGLRERLGWLYEVLIAPFRGPVAEARRLVLVADSSLGPIPLAALWDGAAGRFLIETHTLALAPDVGRAAAPPAGTGTPVAAEMLFLGDPAFDPALFPRLYRLPASGREVRELARLHPGSQLLSGAEATKAALLAALPGRRLLHLSTHGLLYPDSPRLSGLVLARDDGAPGAGLLQPAEVRRLDLSAVELVVLAACDSAAAPEQVAGGVLDLAHPFLTAGAGRVLATLWPVKDEPTRRLMLRFHALHADGLPPEEALQQAQLEVLAASGGSPRGMPEWVPFVVMLGGV